MAMGSIHICAAISDVFLQYFAPRDIGGQHRTSLDVRERENPTTVSLKVSVLVVQLQQQGKSGCYFDWYYAHQCSHSGVLVTGK